MSKTVQGLLEHCKKALKNNVQYVYGAKMQVLTYNQIKALQNAYGTSCVWNSDLKKANKLCCDCSGLISSYTGITKGSSVYKSTATSIVTISELNKNWNKYIGWGLWMQGHIGVVSDTKGYYYAMDGSARNMVHYPMSKQKWTYCIKLCDIDYFVNSVSSNNNTTNSNKTISNVVDTTTKISYNGHIIEYKAKNINGNNYVQARPFLTNLGYSVGYNSSKKRVMAGSVTLDVGTILENGTSYIHLRDTIVFLNKHAKKDYSIIYNMKNKLITITEE